MSLALCGLRIGPSQSGPGGVIDKQTPDVVLSVEVFYLPLVLMWISCTPAVRASQGWPQQSSPYGAAMQQLDPLLQQEVFERG
jgi:hypothetical protein